MWGHCRPVYWRIQHSYRVPLILHTSLHPNSELQKTAWLTFISKFLYQTDMCILAHIKLNLNLMNYYCCFLLQPLLKTMKLNVLPDVLAGCFIKKVEGSQNDSLITLSVFLSIQMDPLLSFSHLTERRWLICVSFESQPLWFVLHDNLMTIFSASGLLIF